VWVKQFGGSGDDGGYSVTVDGSGNVYTSGGFEDTVDFDPGSGTTNLASAGGADVFAMKMSSSGDLAWAKHFGGTAYDFSYSVAADGLGNVVTTGMFQDTAHFDSSVGSTDLTSEGGTDVFVAKLDSSGSISATATSTTTSTPTPATTVPLREHPPTGSSPRVMMVLSLTLLLGGLVLQKVFRRRTHL
jgi:hypothetical protein